MAATADTDVAVRMDLSSLEKNYFKTLFTIADADKDGVIGTADAAFLRKAKLLDQDLGNIWQNADNKQKGFLTEEEFYLALRMIAAVQNKQPISKETAQKTQGTLPHFPEYPPPNVTTQTVPEVVPPVSQVHSQWTITPQEKEKFSHNFKLADADKDGFITGIEARDLFGRSGLAKEILAKIWQLSDVDKDMKLNQTEFVIAMYLISSKLKGIEVPDTLPQSLLSSVQTTAQTVVAPAPVPVVAAPAPSGAWVMTPEERIKFKNIFERAVTPGGPPFVTGDQAKKLFGRSGLQPIDLGKIWMLSDLDKDGKLNEDEFIIAMYLINKKLVGVEVPDSLPESLKPSQSGNLSAPVDSKSIPKPKANYDIKLDELVAPAQPVPVQPVAPVQNVPPVVSQPGSGSFPSLGVGPFAASPAVSPAVSFANFPVAFSNGSDLSHPGQSTGSVSSSSVGSGPLAPLVAPGGSSVLSSSGSLLGTTFDSPQIQPKEVIHPSYAESPAVGKKLEQLQEKRASLETKRDELSAQLRAHQETNSADEREVIEEEEKLNGVTEEIKNLEAQITEEKAKVVTIRERLKYVRLQLKNLKDQKDQFEKILEDKREQYREDEELCQVLEAELKDKQVDIAKTQREIEKVDRDIEEKRKDIEEKKKAVTMPKMASPTIPSFVEKEEKRHSGSERGSAPGTPVIEEKKQVLSNSPIIERKTPPALPKKSESPKIEPVAAKQEPAKLDPFSSTFAADFSSPFTFPTDFNSTAAPPSPKPDKRETPAAPVDPFKGSGSFGTDWKDSPFGDDSFGASKPNASGSEEDEDPFAFSTDLKAVSVDTQEESFGGFEEKTNPPPAAKVQPAPAKKEPAPAFSDDFNSAFDAKFDAKFDFGSSNFGASDFGASSFGEDPSAKSEKKDEKKVEIEPSGFGADFSSAFSSGNSPFDTGADFFG